MSYIHRLNCALRIDSFRIWYPGCYREVSYIHRLNCTLRIDSFRIWYPGCYREVAYQYSDHNIHRISLFHNYCHFTWSFTVVCSTVCSRAVSRRTGRWSSCCWSTGPTSMRWTTRGGLHYMLPPAAATWTYAGQCYVYMCVRTSL